MPDTPILSHRLRRKSLLLLCACLLLGALAAGLWWWLAASRQEETDNAYVAGDLVPVSAYMPGQVTALFVTENADIAQGQLALTLDEDDERLAVEQAAASVDQRRRDVGELYSATRQSDIAVTLARNRVATAQLLRDQARVELTNAGQTFERRQTLKNAIGAVSEEELMGTRDRRDSLQIKMEAAASALAEAQTALTLALEQAAATHARTDGVAPARHPGLRLAEQQLSLARANLERRRIASPVTGIVARRYVQLGQRVAPQQPLFSVVPQSSLYIEANFKETQTGSLRPGQCAEVVSDRFGARVVYASVVESIGVGTGSVFARVPVQNAAGNWVKIVQRVPVRLQLDPEQLQHNPLSLGMSTLARVYLERDCSARLARKKMPSAKAPAAYHLAKTGTAAGKSLR